LEPGTDPGTWDRVGSRFSVPTGKFPGSRFPRVSFQVPHFEEPIPEDRFQVPDGTEPEPGTAHP